MWIALGIVAALVVLWFAGGSRAWRDIQMGLHLSRMATVFEAMERTRHTHMVGAGGGIDSLPRDQQVAAWQVLELGMANLRQFPRHVVTREIVKNSRIAMGFGREERVAGMMRMLDFLVQNEIALGADEFLASYS